jgi:hypothetical protein
MEHALTPIRFHGMLPTQHRVSALLCATDRLQQLIENPGSSNQADIADTLTSLTSLPADDVTETSRAAAGARERPSGLLRMLLVEDDFTSRLLIQTFRRSWSRSGLRGAVCF